MYGTKRTTHAYSFKKWGAFHTEFTTTYSCKDNAERYKITIRRFPYSTQHDAVLLNTEPSMHVLFGTPLVCGLSCLVLVSIALCLLTSLCVFALGNHGGVWCKLHCWSVFLTPAPHGLLPPSFRNRGSDRTLRKCLYPRGVHLPRQPPSLTPEFKKYLEVFINLLNLLVSRPLLSPPTRKNTRIRRSSRTFRKCHYSGVGYLPTFSPLHPEKKNTTYFSDQNLFFSNFFWLFNSEFYVLW